MKDILYTGFLFDQPEILSLLKKTLIRFENITNAQHWHIFGTKYRLIGRSGISFTELVPKFYFLNKYLSTSTCDIILKVKKFEVEFVVDIA